MSSTAGQVIRCKAPNVDKHTAIVDGLTQHLIKERKNGWPMAILFAQFALFVTFLFLNKTTFISKHDPEGINSALSYQIIALLLPYSKHLRQYKFLPESCGGSEVNLFMNSVFLLLVVPLEIFFEKSKSSLGAVLSVAVLVVVLRVIIRPQSDFGVLGFLLGAAESIALSLFKVGYKTWVVVAICVILLSIRFLVVLFEDDDKNQESPPLPISTSTTSQETSKSSEIIEAVFVSGFYLYWDQDLLRRTNCPGGSVIIFCIPPTLKKSVVVPSVVVLGLCSSLAISLRLYTLLPVAIKMVREISMELEQETVSAEVRTAAVYNKESTEPEVDVNLNKNEGIINEVGEIPMEQEMGTLRVEVRLSAVNKEESTDLDVDVNQNKNEGIMMVGELPDTKDGLRQRFNKKSRSVVASFKKVLTQESINSRLEIPDNFMGNLPDIGGGTTTPLTVQDAVGGGLRTFEYYIKRSGWPRPVFKEGWSQYVKDNELQVGDRIIFECLGNYDEPRYRIRAQRRDQETWAYQDL